MLEKDFKELALPENHTLLLEAGDASLDSKIIKTEFSEEKQEGVNIGQRFLNLIKDRETLKEKAGDIYQFLKESGIVLKKEIISNLETATFLALESFRKVVNLDLIQSDVARISIFKNSISEVWVGAGIDEFNKQIKEEEKKAQAAEQLLVSRITDLANLEKISKDVGFEVSLSVKEKLKGDVADKEMEFKEESNKISRMKADNHYFEVKRTDYLAKIEESRKNISDRIKAKIDIDSRHLEELKKFLDELNINKAIFLKELEKLRTSFRDLDKITRETELEDTRRSTLGLMHQIGSRINKLEGELITYNESEGKILKIKAQVDARIIKNEEQINDLKFWRKENKKTKDIKSEAILKEKPDHLPKQKENESERQFSLFDFLLIWNKEFPEDHFLKEGEFKATANIKRDKKNMEHVILNLMQDQHPFSSPKIVKIFINHIYKNK